MLIDNNNRQDRYQQVERQVKPQGHHLTTTVALTLEVISKRTARYNHPRVLILKSKKIKPTMIVDSLLL